MEAELLSEFPEAEVGLVEASGGLFEVRIDGSLLFSKKKLGRHAEDGEVMRLIKGRK